MLQLYGPNHIVDNKYIFDKITFDKQDKIIYYGRAKFCLYNVNMTWFPPSSWLG